MTYIKYIIIGCCLLQAVITHAQYNIAESDYSEACEGTLTDSEALEDGNYDHNEYYTFTVCIDGVESITINFAFFESEANFDFLTVYSGTGTDGAILLGPHSGPNTPSPLPPTAIDSCFTVVWETDDTVTDPGFDMAWTAVVEPPPPFSNFTIDDVPCESDNFLIDLAAPIDCDFVTLENFTLFGYTISTIAPVACDENNQTTQVAVTLDTPITEGGTYNLVFNYTYIDICGNPWPFTANAQFSVTDCPLEIVEVQNPIFVCGSCEYVGVSVTGGTLIYNYEWSPPLPSGNIDGEVVCLTESTTYNVTVTDTAGNSDTESFFVEVCPFEVTIDGPSSFCGNCEEIEADVIGGSPPYTYNWNNGLGDIDGDIFCVTTDTTYAVTVTDSFGATAAASLDISVCPLVVNIPPLPPFCGDCQVIEAIAEGGGWEYTYTWSPSLPDAPSAELCLFAADTYSVTVTDQYGASATASVALSTCPFSASIEAETLLCDAVCTDITAIPIGGSGDFSYVWSPPLPSGATVASDVVCLTDSIETYMVTITDNATSETSTSTHTFLSCPIEVDASVLGSNCISECFPIEVVATGGTGEGTYTYNWDPPLPMGADVATDTICVYEDTFYYVTVTDAVGHTASDFTYAPLCDSINVILLAPDEICYCDTLYALTVGGDFNYTYTWSHPEYITPIDSTQTIDPTTIDITTYPGPYEICLPEDELIYVIVTDGNGATDAHPIEISICPYNVNIDGPEVLCDQLTANVEVSVNNGIPPHTFAWNDPSIPPNAGPHTLNLNPGTNIYAVTVTDSENVTRIDTIWIDANVSPVLSEETIDLCVDAPPYDLTTIAATGEWQGYGIDTLGSNVFNVGTDSTGVGAYFAYYYENRCYDSLEVMVNALPEVFESAACENGMPFYVPEPDIAGGTWSGDFIAPDGLFDPVLPGVHTITYTTNNACTNTTTVTVENIVIDQPSTALCGTPITLSFSPAGGTWSSHPAFDPSNATFYPNDANVGIHELTYTIPGNCSESISIEVVGVAISNDYLQVCLDDGTFNLPSASPTEGYWYAVDSDNTGLINNTGVYNPDILFEADEPEGYTEEVVFVYDDCTDTLTIEVIQPYLTIATANVYEFCTYDDMIDVSEIGQPIGGVWMGEGLVIDPTTGATYFDPATAFPNITHTLTYGFNNCDEASVEVLVHSVEAGEDLSICSDGEAFFLTGAIPLGGLWSGTGIVDVETGQFSPTIAGEGTHVLYYTAPNACVDSLSVFVFPQADAIIDPIDVYFCYEDTTVVLTASPVGGTFEFFGASLPIENSFNPVDLGPGGYTIRYVYGEGGCERDDYISFNVGNPITLIMPNDTSICPGSNVTLNPEAYGGSSIMYTYYWDNGIGYVQNPVLTPTETTTYTVIVNDGCSQPTQGTVTIEVFDPINYTIALSDTVCYGDMGFASINVDGASTYAYAWEGPDNVSFNTPTINTQAGYYDVQITDTETGCNEAFPVVIPSYSNIYADFEPNPNDVACINSLEVNFIDYSEGAINGYWDFGDSTNVAYTFEPTHIYNAPGTYMITFYVENEGGCNDIVTKPLCIELPNDFVIPNAFSPNNDGTNDELRAYGINIESFTIEIYNRWGELVYESNDILQAWDGTNMQGKDCSIGVYVYHLYYKNVYETRPTYTKGNITLIR